MHHLSRFLSVVACVFAYVLIGGDVYAAGYTCPTYKKFTSCSAGYYMTKGGTYNGTPVAGNACTACGSGYTCAGGTANRVAATKSCSGGQYWNGSACATCTAGYRCPGFSNVATSSLSNGYGRYQCGAGTYAAAGASSCTACTGRTKYSGTGASACSTVSSGYYTTGCNSSNNNCTGQSKCGGNAYYCSGGVRNSVSAGYYSTGGDANTRTGQSICTGTNYCTGGVSTACPNATTYKRTTFPANYYSPTLMSASVQGGNGKGAITSCQALSWWSGTRAELYEYANYNSSTGKYDNTTAWAYSAAKAGYYLTDKKGCGSYAYYGTANQCPAGSYCPGKAHVDCNSSNQGTVHTTNFGLNSCPSGYPNSAAGATAITSCYSNNKSRAWTGTQTACALPAGCETKTCNSCSVSACSYVAYSNSAGTGDGTIKSGCSSNSAACQQSVASVTANAGNYISGLTCPSCPAGKYCTGGTALPADCAGATYSAGGLAQCSSCPTGYTANTDAGKTSINQCQIECPGGTYLAVANGAVCSNVGVGYWVAQSRVGYGDTGIRNMCPAGLTTIGYGRGADQADDCGRILNVGDNKIYLRSGRLTTPSLMVGIGDDVFYGNMGVDAPGTLKITTDGVTYSVYDDSMM